MLLKNTPAKIFFWIGFSLLPQDAAREAGWLQAYAEAGKYVDAVLLKLPSWQEAPDALDHELVKKTIDICRAHDIDLYLGRNLWITWKVKSSYQQQLEDVYDPAYYTAYLSRIHAEAKAIGAVGTFVDCEPYGDTIFKPWFKPDGFTPGERLRVLEAIRAATQKVPPVDLAYPAGGMMPNHYSWATRYLGREFLHSKPYRVRHVEDLRATPPPGMPLQLDWWGTWLGIEQVPNGPLTLAEFEALDWAAIKTVHPEVKGAWVMAAAGDRLDVMYRLGGR